MSDKHPIIAITGSSGAGTTTVQRTFESIFRREGINAAVIEGDSFHRYDRHEMQDRMTEDHAAGGHLSHFGPEATLSDALATLLRTSSETGPGRRPAYPHGPKGAAPHSPDPGPRPRGSVPLRTPGPRDRHPAAVVARTGRGRRGSATADGCR